MAVKLEPFDRKCTRFQGLWYNQSDHCFRSATFNLAQLRKFKGNVLIKIIKNKYYNGGENGRPNYLFSIVDAKSDKPREFDIKEVEPDEEREENLYEINGQYGVFVPISNVSDESKYERLYTRTEVQRAINGTACHVGGDGWYGECLVEDYL